MNSLLEGLGDFASSKTKKGKYGNDLLFKIETLAKQSADERIRQRWSNSHLAASVPLLFSEEKTAPLERKYSPTNNSPLEFSLVGGGGLRLGGVKKADLIHGDSTDLAIGISTANSRGEIINHPLVIKALGIGGYQSLERPLEDGEGKEIKRALALFDSEEIILEKVDLDDHNLIIILKTLGLDLLKRKELFQVELQASSEDQAGIELTRKKRFAAFLEINNLNKIPSLFDKGTLEKYFPDNAEAWVIATFISLSFGSAPVSQKLTALKSFFAHPITNDTINDDEFEQVIKFAIDEGLAQIIGKGEEARLTVHPLMGDKIDQMDEV